jgi:hypothetical protein
VQRVTPKGLDARKRLAVACAKRPCRLRLAIEGALPVVLDEVDRLRPWRAVQRRQNLDRLTAIVQRRDERLDKRHRAVECTPVAPGLQIVSFGHVPVALLRCFIVIQA